MMVSAIPGGLSPLGDTDKATWYGSSPSDRRRAAQQAVTTTLGAHLEIKLIVGEAEAHFEARGYASFHWTLGQFDKVTKFKQVALAAGCQRPIHAKNLPVACGRISKQVRL